MKAHIYSQKKRLSKKGNLFRTLSFLLIFSTLASCASFYKLDWEPTDVESENFNQVRNQNFQLLSRNKHYRILDKDSIQHLVYLEGFHDRKLFVVDYTASGKYKKKDEELVEIAVDDIQEIEIRHNPASSVLLTIGAAGFLVGMVAIFGIDFFFTEDDDI
jgi:hypothetical protein